MLKLVILALAMALTGCGGGGSSGSGTSPAIAATILNLGTSATTAAFLPSLVPAKLDNTAAQYVIMAGWQVGTLTPPPVKIYRIASAGDIVDATVEVLGQEFAYNVERPVVADFNNDGIDDIFFAGFTDAPGITENPSTVFLSRPGQSHLQVLLDGLSWSHGVVAVDFDHDGDIDVIDNGGRAWLNDGRGNFTFNRYMDFPGGMGVCAGDFENTGRQQIVLTDGYNALVDNYVLEYNNGTWTNRVTLPTPVLDKFNTSLIAEYSHDVSCVVADIDNDGKQDIVVISADNSPEVIAGTKPHGTQVQVYRNLGNMTFDDITAYSGIPYQTIHSTYTPKFIDFNNDGKLDLWLMNIDWQGVSANQIWINQGNTQFKPARVSDINSVSTDGIMLPIKQNNKWNFLYAETKGNSVTVKFTATQWTF